VAQTHKRYTSLNIKEKLDLTECKRTFNNCPIIFIKVSAINCKGEGYLSEPFSFILLTPSPSDPVPQLTPYVWGENDLAQTGASDEDTKHLKTYSKAL